MPEKTLKEKVDLAKGRLENIYDRYTRERISEALLALEARVEELEKDKLTLFERQALSVVLTWQDGGWDNNERLRKAMLVFYATCKEQYPDIIYGIKDLSEEVRDAEE